MKRDQVPDAHIVSTLAEIQPKLEAAICAAAREGINVLLEHIEESVAEAVDGLKYDGFDRGSLLFPRDKPVQATLAVWTAAGLLAAGQETALASVIADAIRALPIITHNRIAALIARELA